MLIDNHNRVINYLRLAVTDRCNLRCNYCMPEKGARFSPSERLLTIEEMILLTDVLILQGIDKIRITGGEPFVRSDIMVLLRNLAQRSELKEISITTNGTLIGEHIAELKALGIKNINLSMDAVTEEVFNSITRKNHFSTVHANLMKLLQEGFRVKINFVVLSGQNIEEILPMLALTKENDISVRFLEEMPFNGGSRDFESLQWSFKEILRYIRVHHEDYYAVESAASSTSLNFKIPGYRGSFGVIPSFSRTFCGSCNRLRVTATGDIITCLYADPCSNIREVIREGRSIEQISGQIIKAVGSRAKDGFAAQADQKEKNKNWSSMTSIGG